MKKQTEAPEIELEQPSAGGSYERQTDGTLKRVASTKYHADEDAAEQVPAATGEAEKEG